MCRTDVNYDLITYIIFTEGSVHLICVEVFTTGQIAIKI